MRAAAQASEACAAPEEKDAKLGRSPFSCPSAAAGFPEGRGNPAQGGFPLGTLAQRGWGRSPVTPSAGPARAAPRPEDLPGTTWRQTLPDPSVHTDLGARAAVLGPRGGSPPPAPAPGGGAPRRPGGPSLCHPPREARGSTTPPPTPPRCSPLTSTPPRPPSPPLPSSALSLRPSSRSEPRRLALLTRVAAGIRRPAPWSRPRAANAAVPRVLPSRRRPGATLPWPPPRVCWAPRRGSRRSPRRGNSCGSARAASSATGWRIEVSARRRALSPAGSARSGAASTRSRGPGARRLGTRSWDFPAEARRSASGQRRLGGHSFPGIREPVASRGSA